MLKKSKVIHLAKPSLRLDAMEILFSSLFFSSFSLFSFVYACLLISYVFESLPACMYVHNVHVYRGQNSASDPREHESQEGHEPLCAYLELNPGTLTEKQLL